MFGDIFPTLHVAAVIMHAALVVILFYRFPKRIFYPDSKTVFIAINSTCLSNTDLETQVTPITPLRTLRDAAKEKIERLLHIN